MSPEYPTPLVMIDIALFTLTDEGLAAVLWKRGHEPFAGRLALPGGSVHVDEDDDLMAAARRILRLRTHCRLSYLEQLETFSGRDRDPRQWSLSVAHIALMPASELEWLSPSCEIVPLSRLPELPFDHDLIIARAHERLVSKSTYSQMPAHLLQPEFTMAELHEVYEQVLGHKLDPAAFRRKIEEQGVVEPVPGKVRTGAHRPARLYRLVSKNLKSFGRQTVA